MNTAYVYAIVVDGVVRYIGKGIRNRMNDHVSIARQLISKRANGQKVRGSLFYNKLAKAIKNGAVVEPRMLVSGLSDDEAYDRERYEIESFDGDLWNVFSGGRGSTREDCLKSWADPERRRRHKETMAEFLARPDVRQRISEGTKRGLSRPGVLEARRQSQIVAAQRPENKAKKSASSKARWNDPAYVEKRKQILSDESLIKRMSESAKRRGIKPEQREKMNTSLRKRLADPAERERYRQRAILAAANPDVRRRQGEASKKRWADPVWRAHILAARKTAREQRVVA